MAAFDCFGPPMMLVAFRVLRFLIVVPGPPAQEPSAEIRDQDGQLAIERRDLVLEVHGETLVRPEEHLEDVLLSTGP
jgi:hypothetical protein